MGCQSSGFWFSFFSWPMILNIFSSTYWPFVCLLWRNILIFCLFNFSFCIGIWLINNVIVSGEQRQDSAIHRHVSIFPQTCLPSRLPHNRVEFHVYFTYFLMRFFLFNYRRSLYILNINHSSDIWLGNIFYHSMHCLSLHW